MNITEKQLQKQVLWAISKGWLPHYQSAATTYGLGVFDVADYMAITSRETNFNPKYLTQPGDHGNGFGPMQADRRTFPSWIASGAWKDVSKALQMGAKVLRDTYLEIRAHENVPLTCKTQHGERFSIPRAKVLTPNERYAAAIAGYNCGLWSLYHLSKGRDVDFGTTGHDYSKDVIGRAVCIRSFLVRHEAQQLTTR